MALYVTNTVLTGSQWIPLHIPVSSSIRNFKRIKGEGWIELSRTDFLEVRSTNSFSYDDKIYVIMFHPLLKGSEVQIQYEHNGVANPGVKDLLPDIIAKQALFEYNRIISGLFVIRNYMNGLNTGWNGMNMVLGGGLARIQGSMYNIGENHYDLNKFGAQSGENMVVSTLFYLLGSSISETQKKTKFIESPSYIQSGRYSYDEGMGLSSALTELNLKLSRILQEGPEGFIDVLRMTVISQKEPLPPEITFHYENKFRYASIY